MNEILFLEELEESDEVPMLVHAIPVGKSHTARDIVRQFQRGSA